MEPLECRPLLVRKIPTRRAARGLSEQRVGHGANVEVVAVVGDCLPEAMHSFARRWFAHARKRSLWKRFAVPLEECVADEEPDREAARCRRGLHGAVERVV